MRRVVITGMGVVSPVGNTVASMWKHIKEGQCGIGPITAFDTEGSKIKLAGEVKDFEVRDYIKPQEARRMDRFTQFAMVAAREAMEDSALDMDRVDSDRFGCIISSGIGGFATIQKETEKGAEKGYDRVSPHFIPMIITNMAAGRVAIEYGLHGMCSCVVSACAGGTNALGDAFRHIRDGYADLMLAGGTESAITDLAIGGFTSMRALSPAEDPARASIPFDLERNGFVMGEGAGILLLEDYDHARARGAHIYCEVAGYGSTCDAFHVTAPLEDGSLAARSMEKALEDSGLEREAISYINAHGTSTKLNDLCESKAIKKIFAGGRIPPISSTKSMMGHLLGAAGAVEAIICAKALEDDFMPATINYAKEDPDCDLDVIPNVGRQERVEAAMSNSFGFGGHNASLVFKKAGG